MVFGAPIRRLVVACLAGLLALGAAGAAAAADYERRVAEIPMRDGVKLHTLILVPAGAHGAPMLLNRTPFGAEARLRLGEDRLAAVVPAIDQGPAAASYILVFQDVRGKHGSGGDYVEQRPLSGPLNPTPVDHSTDAFDTIDWLVAHTPESNGRVGMIGTSYDGFLVLMALIHPHPALRAAVAINPLVDGWRGDDWFHNGAFRQMMMSFVAFDTGPAIEAVRWPTPGGDDYTTLLAAGSAGAYGTFAGLDRAPFWTTLKAHPAYDGFWQGQALDRLLAAEPHRVPTMYVASLWDQEDGYGALHAYAATRGADPAAAQDVLVIGPWVHGQANGVGARTGPLSWPADTSAQFRAQMLQPFLDAQLKDGAPKADVAPVMAFETGTGGWKRYPSWPVSCAAGCPAKSQSLYLQPGGGLSFSPPGPDAPAFDQYTSDPASPVPYSLRPNRVVTALGPGWSTWLLEDQRRVSARPDVLTYVTAPLTAPLKIAGEPVVNLIASTSGGDSDWVVKLIDVYPDGAASPPGMSGYELAVGMDIFRGRYRRDPARAEAIPAGQAELYRFALPAANHVFLPGHRIMVQVQSSWFPLYDRNPQTFVANIFDARPEDYRAAVQKVFHASGQASYIDLPVAAPLQ